MLSLTFLTYTGLHPVRGSSPPNQGVAIWTRTETPPGSGFVSASGVAVDGTGVYVVGRDRAPGNDEWRIEKRSLGDGSVIWAQTENPSGSTSGRARYIAIDATGIYVAGVDNVPGNDEWRIEKRSLTTGAVVWTQTSNPSTGPDETMGIAVDGTGVYVVGYDNLPGDSEWRIEKRSLTTGALVTTFGTAGVVQENPTTANPDRSEGVAVDASGLYVVGIDDLTGFYEWRIEKRSLTTGLLITTFGTGGFIREAISSGDDQAFGVAVDGSGMYIAGVDQNTSGNYDEWRIEKRALNDGSFVSAFGSGGVVVEDPSPKHNDANVVCVDGTGVYVAGDDQAASGDKFEWRIEKRNLGDGSPIWTQTEHPSGTAIDDYGLEGIVVDATGLYVVGFDQAPGHYESRVEKRNAVLPGLWVVGISLVQGWNLISLPVVPISSAPKVALATVMAAGNVTILWSYTGTPTPTWKSFNPALTSGNTLTAVTDGMGLWVLMKTASTLYAEGYVIPPAGSPSQYPLVAGWNLVGFKPIPDPSAPETVGTYLTSIPLSSYQQNSVFIYDNAAGTWTRADSGTTINPGQAFWILMLTPAKLAP